MGKRGNEFFRWPILTKYLPILMGKVFDLYASNHRLRAKFGKVGSDFGTKIKIKPKTLYQDLAPFTEYPFKFHIFANTS